MNNWIKVLAIFTAIALNYQQYMLRISDLDTGMSIALYAGLFCLTLSGIFVAAFCPNLWARLFWGIVFVVAGISHDAFIRATSTFLTYESFMLMVHSISWVSEAAEQYNSAVMSSLPASVLLFAAVLIPPDYGTRQISRQLNWLFLQPYPLVVILLLSCLLFMRGGMGSNGLPSPFVPLSLSGLYLYDVYSESIGERQQVSIPSADMKSGHISYDIVYIIDESIRGDYLDINHKNGAPSGLKETNPEIHVANFGLATSATNCSIGTNLILRFGGTRKDYRQYINTMPSIWQYAHNAGMETVFIDAQSEDKLYNGMDKEELAQLDRIIQFKDVAPRDRDIAAAGALAELINDDRSQFILLNKLGGHFPIHDKYPDNHLIYQPALPRGEFSDSAISRTIFGSAEADWAKYKNSYKNTISWSIGHFFESLFENADLNNAIILYTSDHGQNFHERGEAGTATHCVYGGKASMEEGVVPMVVITGENSEIEHELHTVARNLNKSTHYNIFPTILRWMQYDTEAASEVYGASLFETIDDPFQFNVRFNARFGSSPVWVKVKVEDIMYPPD